MNRPADGQKCNSCSHPFAKHYTTYDAKTSGCSNFNDDQRDGGTCSCKGFSMAWTPSSTPLLPYHSEGTR